MGNTTDSPSSVSFGSGSDIENLTGSSHEIGSGFEKSHNLNLLIKFRDPEAWKKFVNLYTPLIGWWIRRRGLAVHDMENLRQDVFARLMVSLHQFSSQTATGSFRGWLRTITNNIVTDHFRRHGIEDAFGGSAAFEMINQIPGDESSLASMFDSISSEDKSEDAILFKRIMDWVGEKLPKRNAKIFCALVMEEKSSSTVSEEFKIPVGKVYQIKSLTLSRIRKEFGDLI